MRKFFLLVAFFLFLYGPMSFSEAVVDRVVAVVNQEIITLSEVEKWTNPLKHEIVAGDRLEKHERMETLWRQVLEKLIEEKLIDQEVKKSGIKISSKEIEAALEEVKRRNAITTQEDLVKALTNEGLTLETYKKQIEKGLQRQKLIRWSVKVEAKPGEEELKDFYKRNIRRYPTNETYRASHILFIIPKEATPEAMGEIRKKAQKVLERIKGGEDFGEMALIYSEDASSKNRGDLGYFKRGELVPAFERTVLRLKVGEVSEIVRTDYGFHIIKLLDQKGTEPLPFEEVKEKVQADYYENEMEKAIRQYITNLKEKSVIEIKL
jgi:peptidyl-prolyl cis-trans isomerase SurA